MNLQKYICVFFGEAGREPAIHVKHRTCMAVWQEKMGQTNRKNHYIAYRGLILLYTAGRAPRGNSREIFSAHFWSLFQTFARSKRL